MSGCSNVHSIIPVYFWLPLHVPTHVFLHSAGATSVCQVQRCSEHHSCLLLGRPCNCQPHHLVLMHPSTACRGNINMSGCSRVQSIMPVCCLVACVHANPMSSSSCTPPLPCRGNISMSGCSEVQSTIPVCCLVACVSANPITSSSGTPPLSRRAGAIMSRAASLKASLCSSLLVCHTSVLPHPT